MTLAYAADALIYVAESDSYALRPDFDPARHRVDVEFGNALGWSAVEAAGWNGPDDPQVAQVRDVFGVPVHAGHAFVADRVRLVAPSGKIIRIDMLEIEHEPVACITDARLKFGVAYPVDTGAAPYRAPADTPVAAGFGPGTMIATRDGDLPVEWLARDDEILTLQDGPQPLRWIGAARLGSRDLARQPALQPLRLAPGALNRDGPTHPLLLAPDTRALLSGPDIELHFGFERALARVRDLVAPDTAPDHPAGLTYFTLLFDRHQVIRANGLWCESLFAGPALIDAPGAQRARPVPRVVHSRYALPCLRGWEAGMIRPLCLSRAASLHPAAA